MVQDLVTQTYDKFKGVVASGRNGAHEKNKDEGQPLADDWASYADGRVLSGDQALKLGLVDELGDFDAAVSRANRGKKTAQPPEAEPVTSEDGATP